MRSIKLLGLTASAMMAAIAFVGVSSATAGNTQLCRADAVFSPCKFDQIVTHLHAVSPNGKKAVLLSIINVECTLLFLSTTGGVLSLGAPQVIHGKLTFTDCSGGCTVTEESGSVLMNVLGTASELAKVTISFKVFVDCGFLLKCGYGGSGLAGHALGPLSAAQPNGEERFEEQTMSVYLNHGFCPSTGKLDLLMTQLEGVYIGL